MLESSCCNLTASKAKIGTEQDHYYLKAMNCPHHHRIFAAEPRSYRDLPLRLAEYGTCYRYEQSGELFGLMRVRSLNMNDAHIYCTAEQFAAGVQRGQRNVSQVFQDFRHREIRRCVSARTTTEGLGKKYVNEPELWIKTENMVRDVLKNSGINYVEVANEAAFYGPKIDVQVWSVIGREFTLATNQVDFAVPAKFGLVYRDKDNTDKTPLCIHRAPLGTHERFIGFLIEHYAGNFPLWLAPGAGARPDHRRRRGVGRLRQAHRERTARQLGPRRARFRHRHRSRRRSRKPRRRKVHTMLVIGGRDMEAGNVSVRLHGKGNIGAKPKGEVVADILAAIKERTP